MKELIKDYTSPEVKVIEVRVEKGFASSDDGTGNLDPWGPNPDDL